MIDWGKIFKVIVGLLLAFILLVSIAYFNTLTPVASVSVTTKTTLNKTDIRSIRSTWPFVIFTRVNYWREKNGKELVRYEEKLERSATNKAIKMKDFYWFEHDFPDKDFKEFFREQAYGSKYEFVWAGENLARGFDNPSEVVDAWMKSESHKEVMLNKNAEDMGVGIIYFQISPSSPEEILVVLHMAGEDINK